MLSNSDATGPMLVVSHLFSGFLVAGLLTVGIGLGLRILEWVRLRTPDPLARISFAAVLGLSLLANGFLALGALGILRGWSILLLLVVGAIGGWKGTRVLPSILAGIPAYMKAYGGGGASLAWGLVVSGLVGLFLLVFGSTPPVDWDTLMYHLPIPAQFLQAGRIYLPPDNLHVSFVGLFHMLYLPFLAAGSAVAPALLNGALAALLGLTLFSMGARFLGGETGSIALGLVWGTTTMILVAVTPRIDVTLALFLLLAHYAFLLSLEDEEGMGWAYLGAVLMGFATGVKLNALAYGVGLAPLALWVAWKKAGPGGAGKVRAVAWMCGLGMVAMAPWLLKNWVLLRAPLYPYLTHRVLEPWLQHLYQAAPGVPAPDPGLALSLRGIRAPVSLWGVFFAPGALTAEWEGNFYLANRMLLLLPLALLFLRRKWMGWIILPPVLYLAAILVPFPYTNLRYLIPAVPALTLAVTYAVLHVGYRYLPGRVASVTVLVLATLALSPSFRVMRFWLGGTEAVSYLIGSSSEADFRSTHLDPAVRAYAPVIRHINAELSTDATVLMLFEGRGFPLRPRVIQDNRITNWPYLAGVLPLGGCGEEVGADHLLLATAALRYYQQRGLDSEKLRWSRFEDFAARCLQPEFQVPGYVLFRWKAGAGVRADPPSSATGLPGPPGDVGSQRRGPPAAPPERGRSRLPGAVPPG